MKPLRYLSVCSGIEAASVAWHPLGWSPVAFSEIEPFPCAVLAHHYPGVPNLGDFTAIDGDSYRDAIDLVVGGTPCQAFSVAGLRKGLDDPRGNLTLAFLRLLEGVRPRWLVWENVPGVLSVDDGRVFAAFLGGLAQLGYGFAYRVLDAQYFGVPQRRRRVFVVGHLGDWRRAAAVLFERHSLSGHPAPRREAGQGITHDVAACVGASGRGFRSTGETRGQDPVVACLNGIAEYGAALPTLRAKGGDAGCGSEAIVSQPYDVANCLTQRMYKGINTTCDEGQTPVVCVTGDVTHTLTADGFDAGEDGTGRGQPIVPCSVAIRGRDGGGAIENGRRLRASQGGSDKPHVLAFHGAQNPDVSGSVTHPLGRNQGRETCVAIDTYNQNVTGYVAQTLRSGGDSPGGNAHFAPAVCAGMRVRRLTPTECERLQGFPDGYTAIPWRKRTADDCPDGPRYKTLGNSMAVPVMRWIGERIQKAGGA